MNVTSSGEAVSPMHDATVPAVNRYQPGGFATDLTDPTLTVPSGLLYRGNWQNDAITDQIFYPGDLISYDTSFVVAGTTIHTTNLYMQTQVAGTSNPSADANFIKISGSNL